MRKFLGLTVVLVVGLVLGFAAAVPSIARGDGLSNLTSLVPFIRMGGGVPTLFDAQSTGKGALFAYDLGVNEGQLGIVFGYGMEFAGLSSGQWTIADDGTISGGGCAMAVLEPGWYPMFVILDGRYEIYNLPGISQDSWQKKLVSERVAEQGQHYGCSYTMAEVEIWNPDGTASPFLSTVAPVSATAVVVPAATIEAAAIEAATPAATEVACEPVYTGKGNSLPFVAGDTVVGYQIQLQGATCTSTDDNVCWLQSAPAGGTVVDGAICPGPGDLPDNPAWEPASG